MILPKASELKTHTHTHTHPPHTKNKPTISTSTIARALDGILITIKLTEDVPDQRKAQRVIDSRHEYTASCA